ncbi:hypothetical protein GQ457_02G005840 [Hibiscus cannabinus]
MENSVKTTFGLLPLPCLFFFFFIVYLILPVIGDSPVTPYNPTEEITIDCGSSTGGESSDLRLWIGDGDGSLSLIEKQNKSSATKTETQLPSSVDMIPYGTARLSNTEFTYSIPLTTGGPKLVHLCFFGISVLHFMLKVNVHSSKNIV